MFNLEFDRKRFWKSFAQAYRWAIAGMVGGFVGGLNVPSLAFDPTNVLSYIIFIILFLIFLITVAGLEYFVSLVIEPEDDDPTEIPPAHWPP